MRSLVLVAALCVVAAAAAASAAAAAPTTWAVLVAGSNGFWNYRHQADVCHSYQVAIKHGIAPEHIILMAYNDIANSSSNPVKGKVFNKPTAKGVPGVDVYAGCKIDYEGKDVTPQNFMYILTGQKDKVSGGNGKVLESTANDNVFVFFSDHGGTGLIAFPNDELTVKDLNKTLNAMHDTKMYNKLVFYLEACESGSMFDGYLSKNISIYATTASNPGESSYGCYCNDEAVVDGVNIGSCLGDLYSVNWMENADVATAKETLQQQYVIIKNLTSKSEVMQYGDLSFTKESIFNFEGQPGSRAHGKQTTAARQVSHSTVSSRDARLDYLYQRFKHSSGDAKASAQAADELTQEIEHRVAVDQHFADIAQLVAGKHAAMLSHVVQSVSADVEDACYGQARAVYRSACGEFSDYSLKHTRVLHNACEYAMQHRQSPQSVFAAIRKACA